MQGYISLVIAVLGFIASVYFSREKRQKRGYGKGEKKR